MLASTMQQRGVPEDGEYIRDGLLYCGKCNTPKQHRITMHGEEIIFPMWCECSRKSYEESERESERTRKAVQIAKLKHLSMMSGGLSECTFAVADKDGENSRSLTICERYAEKFPKMIADNRGLLLFGGVGTGKTFAAACIANALLEQGYSVVMVSLVALIDSADEIIRRMNDIDLLILDDLGAERSTDYGFERIYAVADARYRCGKPVIYTSNLPLEMFKHSEDIRCARIFDRVLERCYPVEFRGVSRRKREARRGFEEMNELLGVN